MKYQIETKKKKRTWVERKKMLIKKKRSKRVKTAIIISLYQQIIDSCVKFVSNFQLYFLIALWLFRIV